MNRQAKLILHEIPDLENLEAKFIILRLLQWLKRSSNVIELSKLIEKYYNRKVNPTTIRGRLHELLAADKVKRTPFEQNCTEWSFRKW